MKSLKFGLMASVIALTAVAAPTVALASDTGTQQVTAGFTGGALDILPPSDITFATVPLTSSAIAVKTSLGKVTLSDQTATGNGWHVNIQASQFTEVRPDSGWSGGTSALTLPTGSLSLSNAGASITPVGTVSPAPSFTTGAPWTIDNGTPVKILTAASGQGEGRYDVQFADQSLALYVNGASSIADTTNYPTSATPYESTITWNIVSGP